MAIKMTTSPGRDHSAHILFVGDVVGTAGLELLAAELPRLRKVFDPTFLVVNAENIAITGPNPNTGCGMMPSDVERLLELGVDLITGGNHSWDGPHATEVLEHPRVLRPLNYGCQAPGRGAAIVTRGGLTLGVVNLVSRTALPNVDQPRDALERQLSRWDAEGAVDLVLVDFHGESVSEKQIFAWSFAGRVAAVLGTHTHVATLDTRILPGGTAFVSDVGMTGPGGGMQGYAPGIFIEAMRTRLPICQPASFAEGPAELGAVLVGTHRDKAVSIERLLTPKGDTR